MAEHKGMEMWSLGTAALRPMHAPTTPWAYASLPVLCRLGGLQPLIPLGCSCVDTFALCIPYGVLLHEHCCPMHPSPRTQAGCCPLNHTDMPCTSAVGTIGGNGTIPGVPLFLTKALSHSGRPSQHSSGSPRMPPDPAWLRSPHLSHNTRAPCLVLHPTPCSGPALRHSRSWGTHQQDPPHQEMQAVPRSTACIGPGLEEQHILLG